MDCSAKSAVAAIGEGCDDKTCGISEVLVVVGTNCVDDLDDGVAINPVVTELGLPSEVVDFLHLVFEEFVENVSVVNVEDNHRFKSAAVEGADFGTDEGYDFLELICASFGVRSDAAVSGGEKITLSLDCPLSHVLVEDSHTAAIDDPIAAVAVRILLEGFLGNSMDAFNHALFDFHEPFVDVTSGSIGVDDGEEWYILVLRAEHAVNLLFRVDFEFLNALEALLKMWLDSLRVFGLGKDFEQFIV